QQDPRELERGVLLRGVDGEDVAKVLEGSLAVAPPEREERRLPADRDAVRVGAERRVQGLAGVVAIALAVEEAGEAHPRVRVGRTERERLLEMTVRSFVIRPLRQAHVSATEWKGK